MKSVEQEELLESGWSESVALDPKHRPQTLETPATTVRKEWGRWPQEAHLLKEPENRYRRLSVGEVAVIQGFNQQWATGAEVDSRKVIEALGNAVPPPLSQAILSVVSDKWEWENETFLEICAGIGGLSAGALDIGLEPLALIEYWKEACDLLISRDEIDPDLVRCMNVLDFDFESHRGQVGLLCGGPPCQPWSLGGKRQGESDERDLMGRVPEIINACRPEVFLFENVPGLLSNSSHEGYVEDLVERMTRPNGPNGVRYGVAKGILNAADYGVPQKRRRVFFLGFRDKSHTFASAIFRRIERSATHTDPANPTAGRDGAPRQPWVTLREAFDANNLDDPGGWRVYLESRQDDSESVKTDAASQENIEEVGRSTAGIAITRRPDRSENMRIELLWPTKGTVPLTVDGKWTTVSADSIESIQPLLSKGTYGERDGRIFTNSAIIGNQITALGALRPGIEGSVRLAYMDAPRFKFLEVRNDGFKRSTWMTIVRESALRTRPLLELDGVFVLQVNDAANHYGRMVLEEVFGPSNYVGTFVWQKKYGPQNDRDLPTDAQDYLVVFANDKESLPLIGLPKIDEKLKDDGDPRGPWRAGHKGARSGNEESKFATNVPPYRWKVVDGELPPGIWRVGPESGVIWGTPRKPGTYTFTVQVTDKKGADAKSTFQIEVLPADRIGEDVTENDAPSVSWLTDDIDDTGDLRIVSSELPTAFVNQEYSGVLEAAGGKPWKGKKKPGSGRYWEFSISTLYNALLKDDVYFGASGTAIPSIKKHQDPDDGPRRIRVMTWLPYEEVGKSEDASKHLQALADSGYVERVERIAKPERLMKLLVRLFTRRKGDRVLSINDGTGSMTATAIKLGRRVTHLVGRTDEEFSLWRECALPRLRAVFDGADDHEHGITGDTDVQWNGGDGIEVLEVGQPLLRVDKKTEDYRLDLQTYPADSERFREALCSLAGFRAVQNQVVDAISHDGAACVVVIGDHLTEMRLGRLATEVAPSYPQLTVLYESTDLPEDSLSNKDLSLLRIPFDLVG